MFTFPLYSVFYSLYPVFDYNNFNVFKIVYFSDKHKPDSITITAQPPTPPPIPTQKKTDYVFASRT